MAARILKIAVTACWLILLGLLIQRDFFISRLNSSEEELVDRAKHEQYYGVYFQDKRIGYVLEEFRPSGTAHYQVRQHGYLRLKVMGSIQPVSMDLAAELDESLRLDSFTFSFASPFYTMTSQGRLDGNTLHFTLDTGQTEINDTVTLQEPPLLSLNQRAYLLAGLKSPGNKLKVPFFDPLSLTSRESVITYLGREKMLLRGRVHNLHHYTESYSGIQISFWLDEQGKKIREKSPAGFIFQAEPKFKAMDIEESGDELPASVAVNYSGHLLPDNSTSAGYRLHLPEGVDLELDGGRQQWTNEGLLLTLESFPPDMRLRRASCPTGDSLQASRYVQAKAPAIIARAAEIVGNETDPARQVALLADWVYRRLEKRPVIGLPDALTTLQNGQGDCNEHASLFAALARSLDIPTFIATGVTLHKNAFYYHAWNEVCLNGQWISLDTTTNQLPADLYHIRLGRGDLEEQLYIGALLGKLQIAILQPDEPKKP